MTVASAGRMIGARGAEGNSVSSSCKGVGLGALGLVVRGRLTVGRMVLMDGEGSEAEAERFLVDDGVRPGLGSGVSISGVVSGSTLLTVAVRVAKREEERVGGIVDRQFLRK